MDSVRRAGHLAMAVMACALFSPLPLGPGAREAAADPILGGAQAHIRGAFGPVIGWPLIPLHAALMPDGRVLSYGTDEQGQQTGLFVYDIWDPSLGTGGSSHLVLPNTTLTDLFCSAQTVIAATGELLLVGGDETIDAVRNYSSAGTTIVEPATSLIRAEAPMAWRRWYPTLVTLSDGNVLVVGGRDAPGVPTITPELYTPGQGWRTLGGAKSAAAFGANYANWWYPRAFLAPTGRVGIVGHDGKIFTLAATGSGSITRATANAPAGHRALPTLMYAPGRVLALRASRKVSIINFSKAAPTVAATANVSAIRYWSSTTVLADGRVLLTGGSSAVNKLTGVSYHAEIWDPATGLWTRGASAKQPRLYHSISLLLPDGTVLTGGGGAPGPRTQLNAEIYYPPYLFKGDGSGQLADRPTIVAAPDRLTRSAPFNLTVGAGRSISRATLVRIGSVTHSLDTDQRHLGLTFSQSGDIVTAIAPGAASIAPPGYYLLFVFDTQGVPSLARIVGLGV
jgi:hypothetical protein